MDDKTFIAEYVANETVRINNRLKEMLASETPPTDETRDSVISDIETTLARLQNALSFISENLEDENKEEAKQ